MAKSLSRLLEFYGDMDAQGLLHATITREFKDRIALISSFGADAALLIRMVADVDPSIPVLFLETGKHFQETLDYVAQLEKEFGLTNVRRLTPDPKLLEQSDPEGDLWQKNVNRCCWMRKVEPLNRALEAGEFDAVITGRKRYQTNQRKDIDNIELFDDGIFRVNPLAGWDKTRIKAEFAQRGLPQHPLVEKGFPSIGCEPCTRQVKPGEDERSGRWAHTMDMRGGQKQECGIHVQSGPVEETNWNI